MTKHEIASLASKLLGIYTAIHSFGYLSALVSQLSLVSAARVETNQMFIYAVTLVSFAVTLGIGLYLFLRAEKVASILSGSTDSSEQEVSVRSQDLQTIAFSTVGLVLSLQEIPRLINLILQYWFVREAWSYGRALNPRTYIDFVTSLLGLALGIWLLFGTTSIQRWINRIRGDLPEE